MSVAMCFPAKACVKKAPLSVDLFISVALNLSVAIYGSVQMFQNDAYSHDNLSGTHRTWGWHDGTYEWYEEENAHPGDSWWYSWCISQRNELKIFAPILVTFALINILFSYYLYRKVNSDHSLFQNCNDKEQEMDWRKKLYTMLKYDRWTTAYILVAITNMALCIASIAITGSVWDCFWENPVEIAITNVGVIILCYYGVMSILGGLYIAPYAYKDWPAWLIPTFYCGLIWGATCGGECCCKNTEEAGILQHDQAEIVVQEPYIGMQAETNAGAGEFVVPVQQASDPGKLNEGN